MLLRLENMFWMKVFMVVLMHLSSSFGELNGIELPLELLHEGVGGGGKSMDFAHRINFPLAKSDNGVELPPNVESDMELNTPKGFPSTGIEDNNNLADDLPIKSGMPKWLQLQIQQQSKPHQHSNYHHSNMLPKHTQSGKHHSVGRQVHNSVTSSGAIIPPLKRCSIEISSNIPGVCQAMGSIGNACVSGDYVDVFNAECL